MAKAPKYFLIHEQRILLLALLAGLPALIVAMTILWVEDYPAKVRWTLGVLMFGFWWGCAFAARERVASPPADPREPARSHARR